jgi:hypothetical protein
MSKEFDEFMNSIQKEDTVNKEDTEKAMDKIILTKELIKNISEASIKIVAYFNQDETVWDSKMYEQKRVVSELLEHSFGAIKKQNK